MRQHDTKTTPVFLPTDEEAFLSLCPSSAFLLSGGTMQAENTYSRILKVTSKRRIGINTNYRYHQYRFPKPISTDLTVKSDSVLANPVGKDGVRGWSM